MWKLPDPLKRQLRLGLSRTYKAPATASLVPRRYTVNNNNGPTNSHTQGNPDLRPELAWGLDVACESYFANSGFAGLSAYARHVDSVTTPTLFQDRGEWVNSLGNSGTAKVCGIELELKVPLRSLWPVAADMDVRANLARNKSLLSSVAGPNNMLGGQTPVSANLGFDHRATNAVKLGGNHSYTGPVRANFTSA